MTIRASRLLPVTLLIGLTMTAVAGAAVVTQTATDTLTDDWHTNARWGWAAAGVSSGSYAGNDFVTPAGLALRTPTGNNVSFNGASLTVHGTLALKSANSFSYTKTVNDLRMAGTISNYTDGNGYTQTLAGHMTIIGDTSVSSSSTSQDRHIAFTTLVSGGTGFTVSHTSPRAGNKFTYSNAANSFDGTWEILGGQLIFSNAGSVGAGDVLVNGSIANLQIAGDWNAASALTLASGSVTLGTWNWTVNALTIEGNAISAGTYDVTQLNGFTSAASSFTGSTGTITVIPEPATIALFALAGLCITPRRRSI